MGASLATWSITCIAAQVTVCSKGLSRTITHLERKKSSKGYSPGKGPRNANLLRALSCHKKVPNFKGMPDSPWMYLLYMMRRCPGWNIRVWSRVQRTMTGTHLHHENQGDLRLSTASKGESSPLFQRGTHTPPTKMPMWCSPTTVLTSESWLELRIITGGLTPMIESGSVLWNKTQGLRHIRGGTQSILNFPKKYCITFLLPIPTLLLPFLDRSWEIHFFPECKIYDLPKKNNKH